MSENALTTLLEHTAAQSPLPDLGIVERSMAAGERRLRRRSATRLLALVAAVALIVAGTTWTVGSKIHRHDRIGAVGEPGPGSAEACRRDYTPRLLPRWARTGFSSPRPTMPYVLGDRGKIVAILWADHDPLLVPPAADRNNKILWVAQDGSGGSLHLKAHLLGSDRSATRTVDGGPGPSIIDLPAAGCWSVDLTWGKQHDHLQLEYVTH